MNGRWDWGLIFLGLGAVSLLLAALNLAFLTWEVVKAVTR